MNELTGYSPERPLLLVTDYPPTLGGGGAVILRSLLDGAARARMVWASPSIEPGDASQGPGAVALTAGSRRFSPWLRSRSIIVDSLVAGRLAREIDALAAARNAAAIWIVLHGAMVHVAARLLARSTRPTHLTVHDDPPFGVALLSRRYAALAPFIARDLGHALRRARSIDVISDGMARRYRRLYGVDSTVVHRGMSEAVKPSPPFGAPDVLEVAVLGNTYGYDQLRVLAEAVIAAASGAGVKGRLVFIGHGHGARLRDAFVGRLDVETTGHLDETAAVERLRRCFLLYLNYPFSLRAAVLRQTSFPTKLSTYVLAARPILVHAPRDSSIAGLADHGDYASWWDDERPERGGALIARAWTNTSLRDSWHVAAERVRQRYYDLETNRRAMFGVLNRLVAPGA
jgi:hypothetical protein